MNWEAIAAIGQMLGSVAVLVTLGYLAMQLRHGRQDQYELHPRPRLPAVAHMSGAAMESPRPSLPSVAHARRRYQIRSTIAT